MRACARCWFEMKDEGYYQSSFLRDKRWQGYAQRLVKIYIKRVMGLSSASCLRWLRIFGMWSTHTRQILERIYIAAFSARQPRANWTYPATYLNIPNKQEVCFLMRYIPSPTYPWHMCGFLCNYVSLCLLQNDTNGTSFSRHRWPSLSTPLYET